MSTFAHKKRIKHIRELITKIEKADTIRLIIDGEEILQDFHAPGDIYGTVKAIKNVVINEFENDIEDIEISFKLK